MVGGYKIIDLLGKNETIMMTVSDVDVVTVTVG